MCCQCKTQNNKIKILTLGAAIYLAPQLCGAAECDLILVNVDKQITNKHGEWAVTADVYPVYHADYNKRGISVNLVFLHPGLSNEGYDDKRQYSSATLNALGGPVPHEILNPRANIDVTLGNDPQDYGTRGVLNGPGDTFSANWYYPTWTTRKPRTWIGGYYLSQKTSAGGAWIGSGATCEKPETVVQGTMTVTVRGNMCNNGGWCSPTYDTTATLVWSAKFRPATQATDIKIEPTIIDCGTISGQKEKTCGQGFYVRSASDNEMPPGRISIGVPTATPSDASTANFGDAGVMMISHKGSPVKLDGTPHEVVAADLSSPYIPRIKPNGLKTGQKELTATVTYSPH